MMCPSAEHSIRIAMWSGPRNISTAMMRAWDSRSDTVVCDEPLYAFYLAVTGKPHPAREQILASQPTRWENVAIYLTGPVPGGKHIFYQKHMAHHLLPDIDHTWLAGFRSVFLIREPAEMLRSLARITPNPVLEDTGLPQQVELFRQFHREAGIAPPVLDARDVLKNPRGMLHLLCDMLGVPRDDAMLHWKSGLRVTDGVWAPWWYDAVARSTEFGPPGERVARGELPATLHPVYEACKPLYDELFHHRIQPE